MEKWQLEPDSDDEECYAEDESYSNNESDTLQSESSKNGRRINLKFHDEISLKSVYSYSSSCSDPLTK